MLIKKFVTGGNGPGAYYFPVMIQVVVLMPIIWHIVQRYKVKGLITCFIANVLFEIIKTLVGIPADVYRLCVLRYIFILSYGCFLFVKQEEGKLRKKIWYYIIGCLGVIYITIFNYTKAEPIFTSQWTATSVFAVLFIVPIMMHLMRPNKMHCAPMELLGKSSFNIFLVQMFYYWEFAEKMYEYISSTFFRLLFNVVICILTGVLFYKIENPLTQKVISTIR